MPERGPASRPRFRSHRAKRGLPGTRSQAIIRPPGPPGPDHLLEKLMDRMHMARAPWTGLVALLALAGCGSGRTDTPAPAPETGGAGTAAPTARVMEVPAHGGVRPGAGQGDPSPLRRPGAPLLAAVGGLSADGGAEPDRPSVWPVRPRSGTTTARPTRSRSVYVQLLHNIFAPGARHNTDVPWSVEGCRAHQGRRPGPDPRGRQG